MPKKWYDLLKRKMEIGELHQGDAIMADKGFNIGKELEEIGLKLNIPPFLGRENDCRRKMVKKHD